MTHLAGGSRLFGSPGRDVGSAMKFRFRPLTVRALVTLTPQAVFPIATARVGLPVLPPRPSLPGVMRYPHTWPMDHHPLIGATTGQ